MCDSSCCGPEDEFDEDFARAQIPAALQSLQWLRMSLSDGIWRDGQRLLVATVVRTEPDGPWRYEFFVVSMDSDNDEALLDGQAWRWSLDDVDWYVRLDA